MSSAQLIRNIRNIVFYRIHSTSSYEKKMDLLLIFSILFFCLFVELYASEETNMLETPSEKKQIYPYWLVANNTLR